MKFTPRPYQKLILDFVFTHPRCNVWAGMGMGKTSVSIAAFDALRVFGEATRALVIAPKRVATSTWAHEVTKWRESFGHLTVAVCIGTPKQRLDALGSGADITCVNYDNLEWLVEAVGDNWPWDMVIADECFVSGTPVSTPEGTTPIEKLQVGDLVLTSIGPKKVVRKYEKSSRSLIEIQLINGTRIVCTPSHLFWTESGWQEAKDLRCSTTLFAPVSALRGDVCNSTQQGNRRNDRKVLQQVVFDAELDKQHPEREVTKPCQKTERVAGDKQELERRGSDARSDETEIESCLVGQGFDNTTQSRWERQGDESNRVSCVGASCQRLGVEPANKDKRSIDTQHPPKLQTGFCLAGGDDLSGNRWGFAQSRLSSADGQKERGHLERIGVASVSHIQHTSGTTVWDIEVEDAHEYFAGGVLVHNCTRLKGLRISLQKSTKGKEFLTGQGSVRAKALAKVAFKKVKRWVNLTGSPAPNGVQDLWGQNWYVDKGQRLGSSFSAFESRWFRNVQNSSGYTTLEPLKHAQPEIEAALKDITITIDPKDWFDIKKPIEHIVLVDLPPKARQIYDDLESKLFAEINEHEVEVFNAAARSNKCLQIGSGVVFVNPESREWVDLHDEKIDALRSIVEETNGEPLLVAYQFVPEKEKIVKAFPKAKVLNNDPRMIDDWNKGKIPMLIVHPASAGHGLNLQDGGRILVDFSTGWNLEYDEQVIERIGPTRQLQSGHNRAVYRYRIVAKDTIEQTTVLPRLITKASVQDALKDAMKRKYNL